MKIKRKRKNIKPLQLVVRNLLDGKSTTYDNVIRYEFSKNGKQLAFVTKKPEEKKNKKEEKDSTEEMSADKRIQTNLNQRSMLLKRFRW